MKLQKSIACISLVVLLGAGAACGRDPEAAKRAYFASGTTYMKEQKYAEAIIEFRNAIQQDPRFGEARFQLAQAYLQIDDLRSGYGEAVRAADLLPNHTAAQLLATRLLLVAEQFEDAKNRAEQLLQREPQLIEAQVLRGSAMAGLRDLDSAMTQIQEAIALAPDNAALHVNLAVIQRARGQATEAEAALKHAVSLEPTSITAQLALANYYWSNRRPQEAERILQDALRRNPDDVAISRALATYYIAAGRAPLAEPYLKTVAAKGVDPAARLMLGEYYVLTDRNADARQLFTGLQSDPALAGAARARLAAIEFAEGHRELAEKLIADALEAQPSNVDALVTKAQFRLAAGRTDEALAAADAAVGANQLSPVAHQTRGTILAVRRDTASAIRAFNEVLTLRPRAVSAQLELARLHLQQGQPDAAVQFAGQAIANQPTNGVAHLVRAKAYMARGDVRRAEADMRLLLASNPAAPEILTEYGNLHVLKKDLASAQQFYEKARAAAPRSVGAVEGLVNVAAARNRPADAQAIVDRALNEQPRDARLLLLGARLRIQARDAAGSERLLKQVIEVDPSNLEAYTMLAAVYYVQQRLDEARREFDEIARWRPSDIGAATMAASILQMQGRPDEAQKRYEQILAKDAHAAVAANNLAWLYGEHGGNLDVALQLAQTAKKSLPAQPEVNDTLGWIYLKKNLPSLAISPLRESIKSDPNNPIYHYHLGLVYAKNGDAAKARAALERALSLDPSFQGALEAREALAGLTS